MIEGNKEEERGAYLSWLGETGTREFLQTGSKERAPGASWDYQVWGWGPCFSHKPG